MAEQDNLTDKPLPEAEHKDAPAADGKPAESNVEALTLAEIESFTGKKFPTKDAALKSIKDTYDYVGKPKEPVVQPAPVDPSKFVPRDEYDAGIFYSKHPEYDTMKDVISALAAKSGKTIAEVVEMDTFKGIFEKVKAADQAEQKKSVLHSNPRLGQATDKISQAAEAVKSGNQRQAQELAVDAVMEAYEMGKSS